MQANASLNSSKKSENHSLHIAVCFFHLVLVTPLFAIYALNQALKVLEVMLSGSRGKAWQITNKIVN